MTVTTHLLSTNYTIFYKEQLFVCFFFVMTITRFLSADYSGSCITWTSSADSKQRNHCYWLTSKTPGATSWTVSDAMQKCQCEGGSLAPIIDDNQSTFLLKLLTTIISRFENSKWPSKNYLIWFERKMFTLISRICFRILMATFPFAC